MCMTMVCSYPYIELTVLDLQNKFPTSQKSWLQVAITVINAANTYSVLFFVFTGRGRAVLFFLLLQVATQCLALGMIPARAELLLLTINFFVSWLVV